MKKQSTSVEKATEALHLAAADFAKWWESGTESADEQAKWNAADLAHRRAAIAYVSALLSAERREKGFEYTADNIVDQFARLARSLK